MIRQQTGLRDASWRDWAALALAVLAGLALIEADDTPWMGRVKAVLPGLMGRVEAPVADLFRAGRLRDENRLLRLQVAQSALQDQAASEALAENRRLRILLGLKQKIWNPLVPAEIVGRSTAGGVGAVHLNVGRADSVAVDQVLVTPDGVAGRVTAVADQISTAQLLADPAFRISARVRRSRVLGIVRWLRDNTCVLEGVPAHADVRPGDVVQTSGLSLIYPGGLVIGRVSAVVREPKTLFQRVELQSGVDFNRLETVLVLRSPRGRGESP